jgi:glycosyltransferase involved in cell wall biosynthesis
VHIVHVIARLNDGGPARVVDCLARSLGALGHRVTVIAGRCAEDEVDLSSRLLGHGIELVRIPALGRRVHLLSDARALVALAGWLMRLRPSVVHTHTAKAGALGRTACRILGMPCLHTYHGHVMSGYFSRAATRVVRLGERVLAGHAHHQALTASQLEELALRLHIGRRSRWHCLPIPVEIPLPARAAWQDRLQPAVPVIGFLGRFAPVKDPQLWLEVLARLQARQPVQGLMCGDGALRGICEERAAQLGIPVVFTGYVPAGEALAACDLLLMTSRNEGLPLAVLEAGGMEVAVVASAVGGLRDLAAAGAVMGARRSAEALADACAQVLELPERRTRLIRTASSLARSLGPAALAPRYEALYRAIAQGGP